MDATEKLNYALDSLAEIKKTAQAARLKLSYGEPWQMFLSNWFEHIECEADKQYDMIKDAIIRRVSGLKEG